MKPIVIALAATLAGCAALGGSLMTASDNLEESSARLYDEVRHDPLDRVTTERAAEDLARAAVDFRRAVERDSPRADLEAGFDRIARPYHALREHYGDRAADPTVRDRFSDVTEAYLDVEGALRYRLSQFSSQTKVR